MLDRKRKSATPHMFVLFLGFVPKQSSVMQVKQNMQYSSLAQKLHTSITSETQYSEKESTSALVQKSAIYGTMVVKFNFELKENGLVAG
tara:strand:- start:7442 stop:7708 length:267 start_codon:yes stop_codon:yes gene_type:complete